MATPAATAAPVVNAAVDVNVPAVTSPATPADPSKAPAPAPAPPTVATVPALLGALRDAVAGRFSIPLPVVTIATPAPTAAAG